MPLWARKKGRASPTGGWIFGFRRWYGHTPAQTICTSALATASLSAAWLGKGSPAIFEIRDTQYVTYMFVLNVERDVYR
jgi:hypothetical protein